MKDRKNEKIAYNDSPENLDDIFLIKDKNKPKANKERSSECQGPSKNVGFGSLKM